MNEILRGFLYILMFGSTLTFGLIVIGIGVYAPVVFTFFLIIATVFGVLGYKIGI